MKTRRNVVVMIEANKRNVVGANVVDLILIVAAK
jgi:hypothetical protein